ncbi:MAG: hypothetical protein ACR2IE_03880 [Candidatus Sumerlaeaceae bacterium]
MENANRQQADKMIDENRVSGSKRPRRRRDVAPGLNARDSFGKPGEGGETDYYASADAGEKPLREAFDEIPEGRRAGGPDEGLTGFGPGGASDVRQDESIDEVERRGNA